MNVWRTSPGGPRHPGRRSAGLTEPGVLFDGLGFKPGPAPVIIGNLQEGGAALAAGLQEGDRIVAVDDADIAHFGQLIDVVKPLAGRTSDDSLRTRASPGSQPLRR